MLLKDVDEEFIYNKVSVEVLSQLVLVLIQLHYFQQSLRKVSYGKFIVENGIFKRYALHVHSWCTPTTSASRSLAYTLC